MTDEGAPDSIPGPRESLPARLRRVAGIQVIALAALVGLAILQLGTRSPGTVTPEGVVPPGARILAQSPLGDSRVLLVDKSGTLRVLVAFRDGGGWASVTITGEQPEADYAVTSSAPRGPIPGFTAMYGSVLGSRPSGARVRVLWSDGRSDDVAIGEADGFLAVHPGTADVDEVAIVAPGGAVVRSLKRSA